MRARHPFVLVALPGEIPSKELSVKAEGRTLVTSKRVPLLPVTSIAYADPHPLDLLSPVRTREEHPLQYCVCCGTPALYIEVAADHEIWEKTRPMTGDYEDLSIHGRWSDLPRMPV